jgi:EmrB/QacA subfamily drug resistance transporter
MNLHERPIITAAPRRRVNPAIALLVIAGAQLMVVLDVTIVNVALPHIQSALGFSRTSLTWVISAYTLAFGGLLLLGGRAGDILGRRRMFMVGVSLFATASLLGGFATSEAWLIAARAIQGVGAAIAAPTGLALLATTFAEGPERNRAFGIYAAVAGAGGGIGLILGGVLTDLLSWRWVLFVNVPIGALLALAAPYVLPESTRNRGRFDLPGAVAATAGIGSLVYAFIHSATAGWGDFVTLASFAAAIVLLGVFLSIELRSRQPLVPMRLFAERTRWGSYAVMLLVGAAMFGVFFFLTQYLQNTLHYSPIKTGLAFLPLNLTFIAAAQASSRLVRRIGPRPLIVTGTALAATGLLWLSRITVDSGYLGHILPGMELIAFGLGMVFVPITLTALAGVERGDSGVASAMLNVSQQVGGTLGLSALVTVSATATANHLAGLGQAVASSTTALPARVLNEALVHGWATGFRLAVLFAVAALLTALVVLRPVRPMPEADATTEGVVVEAISDMEVDELPVAG